MKPIKSTRIQSIDLLRGLVMVIMALDHVRDYTHHGYFYGDPTNMDTTTPILFFTRWITHFCAPVFVFLAGTSAFLYGNKRKNKKQLSKFLLTRGLWLIFIELTVVNFAWMFDIGLEVLNFQVIWAIGISMVFLSFLVYLPKRLILILGIVLVAGHNLFDNITAQGSDPLSVLWYFLHQSNFIPINDGQGVLLILYPFVPWLGLMLLGYCFGTFYDKNFDVQSRKKWLLILGFGAIAIFIGLRTFNIYGDIAPWSPQKNGTYSLLSFLNTTKYPPSLLYIVMTLGPSLLFLYVTEKIQNKLSTALVVIGRVPFFFYILHIYLVHLIGLVLLAAQGENWRELIYTNSRFNSAYLATKGMDLWVTYAVWAMVIVLLYPLCKWYQRYKALNPQKWWLSYL